MRKTKKLILTVALFTLSITGMTACGENRTPNSSILASPENVYLCHNQTAEDTTEYILTWDEVENADGYEIEAFGKTFETEETSYDFTAYCQAGKSEKYSVKAVGKEYAGSKATGVREKAEKVASNLVYTLRGVTEYAVSHENADTDGRLVFPDTYDGKPIAKIGLGRYKQQKGITSVRFPKHLTVIGEWSFISSKLTEIIIPEGVTTIEEEAFSDAKTLKTVVFPSTLVVIKDFAFNGCAMESIFISNGVKELGADAFSACPALKTVAFEERSKLNSIGEYAFSGCDNLVEITLPDSLQTIDYYAFYNCAKLTSLHIPKGVTDIKGAALFNESFDSFTVAEENPAYKSVDGNVYSKDGTELVQYAMGKEATEFTVPDEVTKIGDYAFYLELDLLKVSLPQGLKEIGDYAFSGCGITEIDLPYGLTTVGECAFAYEDGGVSNLKCIVLPDSVTSFGKGAFSSRYLEELILSKNIKVIGKSSLKDLRLSFLEIPEGVTFEYGALTGVYTSRVVFPKTFTCEGCISRSLGAYIIDVLYKGTEAEWEALKAEGAFAEGDIATIPVSFEGDGEAVPFPIYFYSEEEPPLNEDGTAYDGNYWRYVDGVPTIWEK